MNAYMASFNNSAFKKLGLDCANWSEPVYLDLLRCGGKSITQKSCVKFEVHLMISVLLYAKLLIILPPVSLRTSCTDILCVCEHCIYLVSCCFLIRYALHGLSLLLQLVVAWVSFLLHITPCCWILAKIGKNSKTRNKAPGH